jgi:hypothetical protein
MALWFAGAPSPTTPRSYEVNPIGRKPVVRVATASTPCNVESTTVYKPHGRHHVPPPKSSTSDTVKNLGDFCIRSGDDVWATKDTRRGRKHVELPEHKEEKRPPPPKPIAQTPYALGDAEESDKPFHGQKRRVAPPQNNQKRGTSTAEDMFVLKRSRTPPVSEKNRPKVEGFCVLHGFADKIGTGCATKANMVPLVATGRSNSQWERTFAQEREKAEDLVARHAEERCRRARERENVPPPEPKPHGKARATTPPPTRKDPPYAINLPLGKNPEVGVRASLRPLTPRRAVVASSDLTF